ncbi:MAG: hypothetical protein MRY23_01925 [Pelagibacteraceae bacterium]|nr:hypothetical protein [Pelagibacteraceae bacterium]MCI5079654.1 hypothetical protein [Pelagibacteraceae bacterium]
MKSKIISFSTYADEYLIYEKKTKIGDKEYKTIIEINKKLVSPYNFALISKKFNPLDFDIIELGEFLYQNEISFKLILPLKNTKGFYYKYFPQNQGYRDHYTMDDNFSLREKRPAEHFEYLDIFNNQINGFFKNTKL